MTSLSLRPAIPADAPAIAQLRVESWRSLYRGVVPDAYLDAMDTGASTLMWHRILTAPPNASSTFVAVDAAGLAGFASGIRLAEPRFDLDTELTAVYVRHGQQRMGLGRRLVGAVCEAGRALAATGMIAWIIAANRGARAFCEELGAELLVQQPYQWDDMDLVEAAYGWRDLSALAAACGPSGLLRH